ncbi:MAG: isocitrate/isopropylmalate dehydrogenase family protein [Deltaproteobacteria bacterium]|nr:isocitrate/isopropylmalate dehydrogenase family protein [Deltaproteobacteria bacterium]
MRTIVTMPGDGIGKVVLPEALRVLDAAGFEVQTVEAEIGWECWCTQGNPLPQRTLDLLEEHRIGLFGAITSKPQAEAKQELAPGLQDKGLVYYSPIVGLRQHFNLDISVRPCRSFPGNPLNFVRRTAEGGVEEPPVDAVIFRQNTEGLYSGVEWTNPPSAVRSALETHPKMAHFADVPSADLAISARIFSRGACLRIVKAAFAQAAEYGYRSVTVCEKPNVIRETSGMMLAIGKEVQREYPEIALWNTNIDAQMMWLTKSPEDYGVLVSGNMFGDIVSDGFAGLVGGLGFAASANIGADCAIFEPTHGSAPKYAEYEESIVNPIAMVLSACLMLDHLGERIISRRIQYAVSQVIATGEVRTYDMMRLKGSPGVLTQGAASTRQMADAIIAAL